MPVSGVLSVEYGDLCVMIFPKSIKNYLRLAYAVAWSPTL